MKTDRFTKSLLLVIAFLLVGNLLALLGGSSTPAYAKPGAGGVQYKLVGFEPSTTFNDVQERLNKEAKNGWRVKACVDNNNLVVILEK